LPEGPGSLAQSDDAQLAQSFRTATKLLISPNVPQVIRLLVPFGFRSLEKLDQKADIAFKLETSRRTMASKSKTNRRDVKVTTT
jgi:hypothetical protein